MAIIKKLFKFTVFICLAAILAGILIFLHARFIAPYALKTETSTIESPMVGNIADGVRIVLFADTHLGEFYDLGRFARVVDKINEEDPDIVVFAGDLIDSFDENAVDTEALSILLSDIDARYGKYCVFGNHDYGGGAERKYPDIMESGGFSLLLNNNIRIDELGLNIIGIDDILIGYGDVNAASLADASLYNIVVAHEPDIADQIAAYDADLMLSGHTHGRQIDFRYLDETFLPPYGKKYIKGSYNFSSSRNMTLYVTRGIGMTQLPLRFNSSPEISLLILSRPEQGQ